MAQGTARVIIPGPPMLLHALTRELVVLRWPLVVLGAVDQVHDVIDFSITHISQHCRLRATAKIARQLVKQIGGGAANPLYTLKGVGAGASATCICDVLLTPPPPPHGAR